MPGRRHALLVAFATSMLIGGFSVGGAHADRRSQQLDVSPATRQRDADRRRGFEERSRDPAAREDRRRSRSAYSGASDRTALQVAERTRRDVIDARPWKAPHLNQDESIKAWKGDQAAVIESSSDDSGGGLLESSLPMRAVDRQGTRRMLDYTLVDRGAALEPDNPLVDLRLPKRLTDGIIVGGDLSLRPLGIATDATAEVTEDKAFWANVRRDTDFIAIPTPVGVETYEQLRSVESPEKLELRFTLPAGAALRTVERQGPSDLGGSFTMFEIVRGDEQIARILPPNAIDADGRGVPLDARVEGASLILHVAHRSGDYKYPIMVDPYVDHYDWDAAGGWRNYLDKIGWSAGPDTSRFGSYLHDGNSASYNNWGGGLYEYSYANTAVYGDYEHFNWRFDARGDAHIYRAELGFVDYTPAREAHGYPTSYLEEGICHAACYAASHYEGVFHDPGETWWNTAPFTWGDNLPHNNYKIYCADTSCSPASGTDHNSAIFRLVLPGNNVYRNTSAVASLGTAHISQWDRNNPYFTGVSPYIDQNAWTDAGTVAVRLTAHDNGLGVHSLRLNTPNASPAVDVCPINVDRGRYNGCPADADQTISYAPPEGVTQSSAVVGDAVDNQHTSDPWTTRIDRSAPVISNVSGSLFNARNRDDDKRFEGLYNETYMLSASASDAYSGLRDLEVVLVDAANGRTRLGTSSTGSVNVTLRTDQFADGEYVVEIAARDTVQGQPGAPDERHIARRSFPVTIDRRGDIYEGERRGFVGGAANVPIEREWHRLGTHSTRVDDERRVTTRTTVNEGDRTFDEVRSTTTLKRDRDPQTGQPYPNNEEAYIVHQGSSPDDAQLEDPGEMQPLSAEERDQPVATGPIADVVPPSYRPPPANDGRYVRYEYDIPDNKNDTSADADELRYDRVRLWLDNRTRLPLRFEGIFSDGTSSSERWDYARSRREVAEVASDFFRLGRPQDTGMEKMMKSNGSGGRNGPEQDRETGQTFTPYYLGPSLSINATPLELDYNQRVVQRFNGESATGTGDPDLPASETQAATRPLTAVEAYYSPALQGGNQALSAELTERAPLMVFSFARGSSEANGWREEYSATAQAVQLDSTDPDFSQTGIQPVATLLQPAAIAYVVAVGRDTLSTLIDVGTTTVIIEGRYTKDELQGFVNRLEAL